MQGIKAIGSGELYGYGLFKGLITQGYAYLLPEKHNDMIFTVAGEELGFVGCLIILIIISAFLIWIIKTEKRQKILSVG